MPLYVWVVDGWSTEQKQAGEFAARASVHPRIVYSVAAYQANEGIEVGGGWWVVDMAVCRHRGNPVEAYQAI